MMVKRVLGVVVLAAVVAWLWWRPGDGRPDILLITVDTLRADALTPYDASRETPGVRDLAADGVVYERAATPIPLTRPALCSIMTGRHPRVHGVLNNELTLPTDVATVAEKLASSGYSTGGFVGTRLLGRGSGLARGFDRYGVPKRWVQVRAEWVVTRALGWLGHQDEAPVFLWVHLFDPHQPYDPPVSFRGGLDPALSGPLPTGRWETLESVARANGGAISAAVLEHVRRLYQAEVEYTDTWVARLLEGFAARRARPSLVVLTADHGECFENGVYFEHSDCLYQGATHVPLIVRYPERAPGRVTAAVDLLAIAPTLVRAAGVEVGSGDSLIEPDDEHATLLQHPLFESGRRPFRDRVIRTVAGDPVKRATFDQSPVGLVGAAWKYLRLPGGDELYEMADESHNLASERPEVVATLQQQLAASVAQTPLRLVESETLNPELRETLKALGYLQ